MRKLAGITFVLVVLLASGLGFCSSSRRALVIGNDNYPGNELQNARNDAKAVSEELTKLGYISTLTLDVDRQSLTAALNRFAGTLSSGDTALLFYAGHGLQVDGENYLVPTDFHVSSEKEVGDQGLALHTVLTTLTEHGATTRVIVLDACRNNPFLRTRSLGGGWANVTTSAGTFLAFGTAPGLTASDASNRAHGLFTNALLHFLASGAGIDQMFQNVRQEVVEQSHGQQVPWVSSSLIGSFHLDPKGDRGAPELKMNRTTDSRETQLVSMRALQPSASYDTGSMPAGQPLMDGDNTKALEVAMDDIRGWHLDKAIQILQAVVSADPRCALALRILGAVLHITGRSAEASEALNRAIQLNPNDALAHSYLCLEEVGTPSSSDRECRQALQLSGNSPEAHVGLALRDASEGKTADAYAEATKVIALTPSSNVGFALRGEIAAADNRPGLAQHDYARAARLAVEHPR